MTVDKFEQDKAKAYDYFFKTILPDWFDGNQPDDEEVKIIETIRSVLQPSAPKSMDLFYDMPSTAAYSNNTTSKDAAKKIQHKLTGLRETAYDYITKCGAHGATGTEISKGADMLLYTAKPRCSELRDAGYIVASGKTRTNDVGSEETVWINKKFSFDGDRWSPEQQEILNKRKDKIS